MLHRDQLIARPDNRPEERQWILNILGLLLVLGLLLMACSESSETQMKTDSASTHTGAVTESPTTDAPSLHVRLTEYKIEMPATITEGPVMMLVENAGSEEHNFELTGGGIVEKLATNLQPGETKELTVNLKPGAYRVHCPVGDHTGKGMETQLTVAPR